MWACLEGWLATEASALFVSATGMGSAGVLAVYVSIVGGAIAYSVDKWCSYVAAVVLCGVGITDFTDFDVRCSAAAVALFIVSVLATEDVSCIHLNVIAIDAGLAKGVASVVSCCMDVDSVCHRGLYFTVGL